MRRPRRSPGAQSYRRLSAHWSKQVAAFVSWPASESPGPVERLQPRSSIGAATACAGALASRSLTATCVCLPRILARACARARWPCILCCDAVPAGAGRTESRTRCADGGSGQSLGDPGRITRAANSGVTAGRGVRRFAIRPGAAVGSRSGVRPETQPVARRNHHPVRPPASVRA